ncbi:MAG TPA: deoxynucleoside kinase [Casimicrobiaceae bacterium]|nr:deoxynucleoside kinase [Casimicrobiaceae bacterium]
MDLDRCRYVVVEGPIGAGKTSLATTLARHLHADTLLELPEDNPFLARFYEDMARYALPAQLNFLFQRVDQLRALAQLDMFARATIADFLFEKDPLFARLTLSDDEYALYDKIYTHLKPQVPAPDLVVYLQAPVATLVERVHRRGVDAEQRMPATYLARLADAYARFFYRYDEAPLLIVNSERLNFVDNPEHFELLVSRIRGMRGAREFFNLGQSA